jgi:hypothetical protein
VLKLRTLIGVQDRRRTTLPEPAALTKRFGRKSGLDDEDI